MDFKRILKELRIERGLTQAQLGEKIGFSDAVIRGWENKGYEPSYEVLCKLAKIFEVTVGQLLGVEEY